MYLKRELCISVAKKPGKFGETVHNAGYKEIGLDFQYRAFSTNDIVGVIKGVRALGIRGCSVSMPFKEEVYSLVDELDSIAKSAKAVNTIVNHNGHLVGHNTDVLGIKKCLQPLKINKNKKIIVLGSGGVARAIILALKILKFKNITISNRTSNKGKNLAKEFNVNFVNWVKRNSFQAEMIINATSIGMFPDNKLPILNKNIKTADIIVDVVVSPPDTKLIQLSKKYQKISVNGSDLALYQACEQFKLYTGRKPPIAIMKKAGEKLFGERK
jgi:shikimate dehydrogenase